MSVIRKAVDEYLALRRSLGFKLCSHQYVLHDFVSYFEKKRLPYITNREVLHWAKLSENASPRYWASRITKVRGFAQHWSATDTRTEIPPLGMIPYHYVRSAPYIYKDEQIVQLIKASKHLQSKTGLRQWTYSTLFGLIAVAGLRISEAVNLKGEDVDLTQGVITIRQTKFGKTRLVPVHSSTQRALQKYVRHRESILSKPKTDNFFVSEKGTRLTGCAVRWIFISLSRQIGLRGKCDGHGPRIHDLRHTLAVKLLMNWYRAGLNVEQQMPKLSAYLGHAHITDTYWYLSATPELLRLASNRLEHLEKRKLS
jgi:integrase